MRKPGTIEHAYLDFDSFFASVEQQRRPWLRGRPVGIRPTTGNDWGGIIAASKEAKAAGVRGVMSRRDALKVCPDIAFVSQDPAMYRRAHNAAVASVKRLYAEPAVKSIDEMAVRLDPRSIADPHAAAARIKAKMAWSFFLYVGRLR